MGRNASCLLYDLVERARDRAHTDRRGARPIRAHTELHLLGVAVDDLNLVDGNPEAICNELRERRLVALAVTVRASQHLDRARRIDANFGGLPETDART